MTQEFDIYKASKYLTDGVILHRRLQLTLRAEIAVQLVQHLAIVAAQEDGEDSAGRRAFKLQPPEQVATRACEIADKMVDEFERRGWRVEIPAFQDVPPLPEGK